MNDKGENVTWHFIDVADVHPVNELKHGAEIFSSTREEVEPDDYINFIRIKSLLMQSDQLVYA